MTEPVEQKRTIAKAGKWVARTVLRAAVKRAVEYVTSGQNMDLVKEVLRGFGIDL
ncbi:hypothetical protein [Streptomyces sp. UG1]|uniref:hypothetical protein n=1 Tax=Streptomyces sp. UG1 TaxID=3417652 RepID=UPI003CEC0154